MVSIPQPGSPNGLIRRSLRAEADYASLLASRQPDCTMVRQMLEAGNSSTTLTLSGRYVAGVHKTTTRFCEKLGEVNTPKSSRA